MPHFIFRVLVHNCQVFLTFFHQVFYAESEGHCLFLQKSKRLCLYILFITTMPSGSKKMTQTSKCTAQFEKPAAGCKGADFSGFCAGSDSCLINMQCLVPMIVAKFTSLNQSLLPKMLR
jgi:hypothetical protein